MQYYYTTLRNHFTSDMVSKAAKVLEEKDENVAIAVDSIVAGMLGMMVKKGRRLNIKETIDKAANLNILADTGKICQEEMTPEQQSIGDELLQELLGDCAAQFTEPIAEYACISKPATNRLVAITAPIVAGVLGEKVQKKEWNITALHDDIKKQSTNFVKYIPAALFATFEMGTVLEGTPSAQAPKSSTHYTPPVAQAARANTTTRQTTPPPPPKKKNRSWLGWLIVIILIILIILIWRSCRNNDTAMMNRNETTISSTQTSATTNQTVNQTSAAAIARARQDSIIRARNAQRSTTEITLPNGQKITAYADGIEKQVVDFLNSNTYKNARNSDLTNKWFEFDNLNFEFNSSSELMNDSKKQVDNIAAILKSFKNAKIVLAGFADKRGSEDVNMEISKERAKTIESMLDNAGVGSQIDRTVGYGDEYAKYRASAPDEQRMKDRDIALRFVK